MKEHPEIKHLTKGNVGLVHVTYAVTFPVKIIDISVVGNFRWLRSWR